MHTGMLLLRSQAKGRPVQPGRLMRYNIVMPLYTDKELAIAAPAKQSQIVGEVQASKQNPLTGAFEYEVELKHPVSGKTWTVSGVHEVTPRFYTADAGRYTGNVVLTRSSNGIYEIIGPVPDGGETEPATVYVGDAAAKGAQLTVSSGGVLANDQGAELSLTEDTARITGPDSTYRLDSDGPALQDGKYITRRHRSSGVAYLQPNDGANHDDEVPLHYALLHGININNASYVLGKGLRVNLDGEITLGDDTANIDNAYIDIPLRLSEYVAISPTAASELGEVISFTGELAAYDWAAPTIKEGTPELWGGNSGASLTIDLGGTPPGLTYENIGVELLVSGFGELSNLEIESLDESGSERGVVLDFFMPPVTFKHWETPTAGYDVVDTGAFGRQSWAIATSHRTLLAGTVNLTTNATDGWSTPADVRGAWRTAQVAFISAGVLSPQQRSEGFGLIVQARLYDRTGNVSPSPYVLWGLWMQHVYL